jgi:hypothetical protein
VRDLVIADHLQPVAAIRAIQEFDRDAALVVRLAEVGLDDHQRVASAGRAARTVTRHALSDGRTEIVAPAQPFARELYQTAPVPVIERIEAAAKANRERDAVEARWVPGR